MKNNDFKIVAGVLQGYYGESADIIIPDNVTEIDYLYAFSNCKEHIKSIEFPTSLKKIETFQFKRCTSLTRIVIRGNTIIGDGAFYECCSLTDVVILGNGDIEKDAFSGNTELRNVSMPMVENIGEGAFRFCKKLETVVMDSVVNIGEFAFDRCISLKNVVLPKSLYTLGSCAFSGCYNLSEITIPGMVIKIDSWAFSRCKGLKKLTTSFGVRKISYGAFKDCTNLTEVRISDSVTDLDETAFEGCVNLIDLSIPEHLGLTWNPKKTKLKKIRKGCYVATCVYGSYDCPQVWTLRRYRDNILASTWYGRAFIRTYYKISPTLVKWFGKTKWFKKLWKNKLDSMIKKLNDSGVEDTPYQD